MVWVSDIYSDGWSIALSSLRSIGGVLARTRVDYQYRDAAFPTLCIPDTRCMAYLPTLISETTRHLWQSHGSCLGIVSRDRSDEAGDRWRSRRCRDPRHSMSVIYTTYTYRHGPPYTTYTTYDPSGTTPGRFSVVRHSQTGRLWDSRGQRIAAPVRWSKCF